MEIRGQLRGGEAPLTQEPKPCCLVEGHPFTFKRCFHPACACFKPSTSPRLSLSHEPSVFSLSLLDQSMSHPCFFLCFWSLLDVKVLVSKRFHLSLSCVSEANSFFQEYAYCLFLCLMQQTVSGVNGTNDTQNVSQQFTQFTASSTRLCLQNLSFLLSSLFLLVQMWQFSLYQFQRKVEER